MLFFPACVHIAINHPKRAGLMYVPHLGQMRKSLWTIKVRRTAIVFSHKNIRNRPCFERVDKNVIIRFECPGGKCHVTNDPFSKAKINTSSISLERLYRLEITIRDDGAIHNYNFFA